MGEEIDNEAKEKYESIEKSLNDSSTINDLLDAFREHEVEVEILKEKTGMCRIQKILTDGIIFYKKDKFFGDGGLGKEFCQYFIMKYNNSFIIYARVPTGLK